MFICENCGSQTKPGEKQTKKVTKRRTKIYPCDSVGWEIEQESGVCQKCKEGGTK